MVDNLSSELVRYVHLNSPVTHRIRNVLIHQAYLGRVVSGHKKIFHSSSFLSVSVGKCFVLPYPGYYDMLNVTHNIKGYQAELFYFSESVIERFFRIYPEFSINNTSLCHPQAWDETTSLSRLLNELKQEQTNPLMSLKRRQHKTMELLLLLAEHGIVFSLPKYQSITEKITQIISQYPEKNWTTVNMAQSLNMGESTLRRKLSKENTLFSKHVKKIRMQHALTLILSTSMNISQIALACGYKSHSRFSEAFSLEFQHLPSQLRH